MWSLFTKKKTWRQAFEEGIARGSAGKLVEAEASFREAVLLAPDEPYPRYELGYTLFLMGRCPEALAEFRRTEDLQCGFFLVQTEIYLCEQFLARTIDWDVVTLLRGLQRLMDERAIHTEEAKRLSTRVTQVAPNCPLGHYYLGKILLNQDPIGAEVALRRCIDLNPDDTTAIDAKFHLGILMRDSGRLEEARTLWKTVLADYPCNPRSKLCDLVL